MADPKPEQAINRDYYLFFTVAGLSVCEGVDKKGINPKHWERGKHVH